MKALDVHSRYRSCQVGGVATEAALVLPLFLFCIFAILWIGTALHANNALTTSIFKALRLSVTRGDAAKVGSYPISALNKWAALEDMSGAEITHLHELLKSPDIDWLTASEFHNSHTIEELHSRYDISSLQDLPPRFLYALAYMYQGMRESIGPSLRYPCDPSAPGNEGCLSCSFFLADPELGFPLRRVAGEPGGMRSGDDIPLDGVGLNCEYKPALFLVTPAMNALGALLGRSEAPLVHLRSRLFFSAPL